MASRVVVFLDALDPRRASGFLGEIQQGRYSCHFPCVTPTIMGSILTGKAPSHHGLVSPTSLRLGTRQRPIGRTVLEDIGERMRTIAVGIPYTDQIRLKKGHVSLGEADGGGEVHLPFFNRPNVPLDMGHENPEAALQHFMDLASMQFATLRDMIRVGAADTYFVGFRNLDSFTHWHQEGDYYDRLQDHLGGELAACMCMGDDIELLVFSDHGSMPAHDVFRINLFLQQNGWMDFNALWGRHKKQFELQKKRGKKGTYHDQIGPFSDFIEFSPDSKFISDDVYDSCVDVMRDDVSDADVDTLCTQLMETGHFWSVKTREQLYPGLTEDQYNVLPKIIPHRKEGVLVSSNMMPGLPVSGYTSHAEILNLRNGDHWPEGYVGSTVDLQLPKSGIVPEHLRDFIDGFAGNPMQETNKTENVLDPAEQSRMAAVLEDLGYA